MERSYGCKTTGILSGNRGCRYDQRCGACSSHDTATAELSGKDARRRTSGAAFLRGTKKITLTEAGKTLYDRAGSLLTMADITKREVIKASQAATIHIGFTPSTVSMMSDYLIRFPRRIRIFALISTRDRHLRCGSSWKTAWSISRHSGHRLCSKDVRAGL